MAPLRQSPPLAALALLSAVTTCTACGATGTSTGTAEKLIGGAEGDSCDTMTQKEGCYVKYGGAQARMKCSGLTGLWTEAAECADNEICKQFDDPDDDSGTLKMTECKEVFTPKDWDASSANDGGTVAPDVAVDAGSTDTVVAPVDAAQPKPDVGPVVPPAKEVDPNCIDGKYTEPLPNANASLAAEYKNYKPANVMDFIYGVLGKRYPFGGMLVQGAIKNAKQNCVDMFLPQSMRGSAQSVMSRMGVIVHECGHMYDIYPMSFSDTKYAIYGELEFKCKGLRSSSTDTGSASPNSSFPRSLLKKDSFGAKRPPCETGKGSHGCDKYAKIYLDGDPKNGKFESGDQGFNMLFEEVVQYVNSLVTGHAFKDKYAGAHSDRDGILTFLWYLERYLHMARTQYPQVHATLKGDPCWRTVILTVWGRAWLHLKATEEFPVLGLEDDKIIQLVRDPALLQEIAILRQAAGCK